MPLAVPAPSAAQLCLLVAKVTLRRAAFSWSSLFTLKITIKAAPEKVRAEAEVEVRHPQGRQRPRAEAVAVRSPSRVFAGVSLSVA